LPNSAEIGAAFDVLAACRRAKMKIATAESCTGGLVAAALTEIPGSSDVIERGFVTYSNEAKTQMLSVDPALIEAHGAVSEIVARAMAHGAVRHSQARVAVAVTGVAGPSGGSAAKPVGTVWFGFMVDGRLVSETRRFEGDRAQVRAATVGHALHRLIDLIDGTES
jgi:nicotinamide-nucleotide amidase